MLAVAALEARARAADSLNTLAFSLVNDPYPLLGFRQALVFDCTAANWELLATLKRWLVCWSILPKNYYK